MSNEEMAVLISGGKNDLLSNLYVQNKALIYQYAYRFYNRHLERCRKCGIEIDDLCNEAFFALCEAVEAYCKDKEYKFTSYLRYPLQNRFNVLIGYRTKTGLKEPLNNCMSLDKPIYNSDGEELELKDIISDETASFEDDVLERFAYSGIFSAVKETLQDDFAYDCIDMNYRQGISQKTIAEKYGLTGNYISFIIRNALGQLKKKPNTAFMRACHDVIDVSYRMHGVSRFNYTWTSSTEWAVLKLIENDDKFNDQIIKSEK